ncbi:MAG: hypothetical protein KF915_18585 [Polyangiaceae bacterium]|nr:hypothetical protein [Polyangiaceae bacterium]
MEVPVCPCERCGAALPLEAVEESPRVRCIHCYTETSIDEAQRARVLTHVTEVRAAWRETLLTTQRTLADTNSKYAALFLAALIFSVLLTVVVLSPEFPVGRSFLALTLSMYVATGLSARGMSRIPSVAMLLASGIGACGQCGGPVRFEEGASAATCGYCRADCLVNPTLKARMITAAGERLQVAVTLEQKIESKHRYDGIFRDWPAWAIIAFNFLGIFAAVLFLRAEAYWEWNRPIILVAVLLLLAWAVRGFNRRRQQQLAFNDVIWGRARPSREPAPSSTSRPAGGW